MTLTPLEKAKRGWWASVIFMIVIVGLVIFLTYVRMVDDNREIIIGIIGMLTGSISSMLAIASGRDPNELEDIKDQLADANGDRSALIARLRDCQIQNQLKNDQVFELQTAIINKLSVFSGEEIVKTKGVDQVVLHTDVDAWTPKASDHATKDS